MRAVAWISGYMLAFGLAALAVRLCSTGADAPTPSEFAPSVGLVIAILAVPAIGFAVRQSAARVRRSLGAGLFVGGLTVVVLGALVVAGFRLGLAMIGPYWALILAVVVTPMFCFPWSQNSVGDPDEAMDSGGDQTVYFP